MISKSWSTSKKRAAIYRDAGRAAEFYLQLFPLLVAHSDDYGRQDGDAETVKMICDPGSPRSIEEFDAALSFMERVGLIQRYRVGEATWLQIVKFDPHQSGMLSKRSLAKSPEAPNQEVSGDSGIPALTQPNLTQPNSTQQKISAEPEGSTPVLVFPTVGPVKEWTLSKAQIAEWADLFPALDVTGQCRSAKAWLLANLGRRKTAKGMKKFLVGWLTRNNDRGRQTLTLPPRRAEGVYVAWECAHTPRCSHRAACEIVSLRKEKSA